MSLSTTELLNKYSKNISHSEEVCRISLMIFDGVNQTLKEMSEKQRKYLEIASILHDVGHSINSKNHNKYSQKIILENGLEGFDERQKRIISCIARYHRGSLPDKKEHEIYCLLDKKDRKIVKRLAGILRIADGLDKAHMHLIKNLRINYDYENNIVEFYIICETPEFRPDIFPAIRKKDLFEIGFKTQVIFKFE